MNLALLDCHWWNEPARPDNPYHHQEIQFGRHLNFTLSSMLLEVCPVTRVSSDIDRPQDRETSMQLKARDCKGTDVALETHFNNAPPSWHGFLVEVKRGDPVSELLGSRLAASLAETIGHTVQVVQIPDPDYVTHRLFTICPVPFVLVELGNLARPSTLKAFLNRGEFYFDVIRALVRGIKDFQEVHDGGVDTEAARGLS